MNTIVLKADQIQIVPGFNSRVFFNQDKIAELAETIKAHGIISPLTVRPTEKEGIYQLIAGERRYRAGVTIGLDEYPAVVRNIDDRAAIEIMAIENLQRQDLHPIEEADAVDRLIKAGLTNQQIADKIGMSAAFVSKRNTLNNLSDDWKKKFFEGAINLTSAMAIARIYLPDQKKIYKRIAQEYTSTSPIPNHEIDSAIKRLSVTLNQQTVPFSLDDATLYPKAGACTTCPKRSCVIRELFNQPDKEETICLDSACFDKKEGIVREVAKKTALQKLSAEQAKKAKKEKLTEKEIEALPQPELLEVTFEYSRELPGVINFSQFSEVDKNSPGALPAVVTHGQQKFGKLIYIRKYSTHTSGPMNDEQKQARQELIVSNKIDRLTTRMCVSAIADDFYRQFLESGHLDETVMLHILTAKIGYGQSADFIQYLCTRYGFEGIDFSNYSGRREDFASQIAKLDNSLKLKLLVDSFFLWTTVNDMSSEVMGVAEKMTGVDVDAIREEAAALVNQKKGSRKKKQGEPAQDPGRTPQAVDVPAPGEIEETFAGKPSEPVGADIPAINYGDYLNQWTQIKAKAPAAILLLEIGDHQIVFDNDASVLFELFQIQPQRWKGKGKVGFAVSGFKTTELEFYEKALAAAGHTIGRCGGFSTPNDSEKLLAQLAKEKEAVLA